MVVDDFHVFRRVVIPPKDNAPLIVDPDRPSSLSIALKLFKPIAWRRSKVFHPNRRVDHVELAQDNGANCPPSRRILILSVKTLRVGVSEASDHAVLCDTTHVSVKAPGLAPKLTIKMEMCILSGAE
jgi:hypothetical protein